MSDTNPVSSVSTAAGGNIPTGLEAAVPVPRAFPPPRCFPDPEPSKASRSLGKVRRNEGSGEQREANTTVKLLSLSGFRAWRVCDPHIGV